MKRKTTSLFLGICLVILAATASPAFARSTTAYNSFKVWMADKSQFKATYSCLTERFGAVVNQCAFPVSLLFDVPVDTEGSHSFTVQNYFDGSDADNTFNCQAYAYDGKGDIVNGGTIAFTASGQSLSATVTVSGGNSAQLICKDIPEGGGVANINWNP
ncbi:MAG: hypothetical protein WAK29_12820 [Terriglobales bacterium]